MKTKWLFPHTFRLGGWFVFIPSLILGLANLYDDFQFSFLTVSFGSWQIPSSTAPQNLTDEVAAVGVIAGLLLIAFSREKVEDEMIGQLRLEALQWSVYANYIVLIIAILTVYDTAFLTIMIYNMFTVLLVFIIRFRWLISGITILYPRYEKSA